MCVCAHLSTWYNLLSIVICEYGCTGSRWLHLAVLCACRCAPLTTFLLCHYPTLKAKTSPNWRMASAVSDTQASVSTCVSNSILNVMDLQSKWTSQCNPQFTRVNRQYLAPKATWKGFKTFCVALFPNRIDLDDLNTHTKPPRKLTDADGLNSWPTTFAGSTSLKVT